MLLNLSVEGVNGLANGGGFLEVVVLNLGKEMGMIVDVLLKRLLRVWLLRDSLRDVPARGSRIGTARDKRFIITKVNVNRVRSWPRKSSFFMVLGGRECFLVRDKN